MNTGKGFLEVFCCVVWCLLAASCGPSPEELAATSAAQTAAAASPTALPTSTPTPTFTPTPTLTPTPTPVPDPDPKAMLKWREAGFPEGIIAVPPSLMGIEEGAYAFSLLTSDFSVLEYYISGSFAFRDDLNDPSQMIYGYSVLLPSSSGKKAFDELILHGLNSLISNGFGIPLNSVSSILTARDIADASAGVTAPYDRNGEAWEVSMISFRLDDIGAWLFIRNQESLPSSATLLKVARVYADSIQRPVKSCQLLSFEPDVDADVPTFNFVAEGFYPYEGRMITLSGDILLGGETITGGTSMLGMEGESADTDGKITDVISFPSADQLASQGMDNASLPPGPNEYILKIMGYASGCEIEEKVTWPGD